MGKPRKLTTSIDGCEITLTIGSAHPDDQVGPNEEFVNWTFKTGRVRSFVSWTHFPESTGWDNFMEMLENEPDRQDCPTVQVLEGEEFHAGLSICEGHISFDARLGAYTGDTVDGKHVYNTVGVEFCPELIPLFRALYAIWKTYQ